jgi:hypothetical protein
LCSPLLPSPATASAGSSAIRIAASLLAEPGYRRFAVLPVQAFYFSFFPPWLNLSRFNLYFRQQDCYLAEWHVTVDVPKAAFGRGCVRHGAPVQQQAPSPYSLCCHLGRSI